MRNTLASVRYIDLGTEAWGRSIEHFVYTELRAYLDYTSDRRDLSFWRTRDNRKIDFIIGDDTAIEVKATSNPSERHIKNLAELEHEGRFRHRLLVCAVDKPRKIGQVEIVPLNHFLQQLWKGVYTSIT